MSKMFKLAGTLLAGLVLVLSLAQAPTARAEEPVTSDLPPDIKAMKLDPQDPNNRVTTVEFEGITATLVVSPDGKTHRVFTSGGILDEYVGIRVRVRFDENGPYIAKVCGITPEMVDEILAPLPPGYTCEGYPYNGGPSIMGENTGFSTYSHYSEGGLETRAGVYQDYSWDGEDVTEVGDPVPLTAWTSDWRRLDVDTYEYGSALPAPWHAAVGSASYERLLDGEYWHSLAAEVKEFGDGDVEGDWSMSGEIPSGDWLDGDCWKT